MRKKILPHHVRISEIPAASATGAIDQQPFGFRDARSRRRLRNEAAMKCLVQRQCAPGGWFDPAECRVEPCPALKAVVLLVTRRLRRLNALCGRQPAQDRPYPFFGREPSVV